MRMAKMWDFITATRVRSYLKRSYLKWILLSIMVFALGVTLYYRCMWLGDREAVLRSVDDRLSVAADLVPMLLSGDFHDRAVGPESVSLEEELLNRRRFNEFVEIEGLRYAQTLVRLGGKFYFSASTVSRKEARDRGSWYFYPYDDAPESLGLVYDTGQAAFLDYRDRWGEYRSLCKRFFSPGGIPYLVLVDMGARSVNNLLAQSLYKMLVSAFSILLMMSPLGCILCLLGLNLREANARLEEANRGLSKQVAAQRDWLFDVESAVRQEQDKLEQVQELHQNSLAGFLTFDGDGKILEINQTALGILGVPPERKGQISLAEFGGPFFWDRLSRQIQNAEVRDEESFSEEIGVHRLDGTPAVLLMRVGIGPRESDEPLYYASFVDISEMKSNQEQLRYLAYHDDLSGLLNRMGLRKVLMDKADLYGRSPSVFVLAVRNFKRINAALGASTGDSVLAELAKRLGDILNPGEELARLGGMEFAMASFGIITREESEAAARRLLSALDEPFLLGGRKFMLSGSLGVMMASDSGTVDETMSGAALAAAESKRRERGCILFFSDRLKTRSVKSIEMENALREAILQENFKVVFQPIVAIRSRRTRGVEALVRWTGSDGKPVSPEDFIPMAEETGMMPSLSEVLFRMTARAFLELRQAVPGIYLSLNVSAVLFHDRLVESMLQDAVEGQGILPSEVLLEITETALIANMEDCRDTLVRLNGKGYTIAIDDFGAGNSSISYLQNFPISKLKIDKSFVQRIVSHGEDWTLVRAILRMSEVLQVDVVAEGVETEEQEQLLDRLNCPLGQGYLYYRPMDLETCLKTLGPSDAGGMNA